MTLFGSDFFDLRFAVIDVETTGIAVENHRIVELAIVELAIVELDGRGVELEAWSTLFSLPGEVELGASHIHGITRAMTAGAPTFADVADEIVGRLRDRVIVGHVVAFDISHLAAEFSRAGVVLPALGNYGVCTRQIVKQHDPTASHTLTSSCERLGLSYVSAHRALDDARATAALFGALRDRFGDCGATRAHLAATAAIWPSAIVADDPWMRPELFTPAVG